MSEKQRRATPLAVLEATWKEWLYGGSDRTVSEGPYLRDGVGVQRYLAAPTLAASVAMLGAIYFFGLHVLAVVAVALAAGGGVALAFGFARGRALTEGLLLIMLVYSLLLPPQVPLWIVALGALVAVGSRELFGGLGYYVFHPALVGKAFLILLFPAAMTTGWVAPFAEGWGGFTQWASQTTAVTPLMAMGQGVETPWRDLLIGSVPGALGATSGALLLIVGAWLLATRTVDRRISLTLIATVAIGQALLGMIFPETFRGGWPTHVLAGGTLFTAFLVATDPVTSPMTPRGKWIYALSIGLLVLLLRAFTSDPEGVTFSVLIVNLFVPLLDNWTTPRPYGGRP